MLTGMRCPSGALLQRQTAQLLFLIRIRDVCRFNQDRRHVRRFQNEKPCLLHGRTAYEAEDPGRSVLTSSVDMEEFFSTMRLLEVALHGRESPTRYALGMVS